MIKNPILCYFPMLDHLILNSFSGSLNSSLCISIFNISVALARYILYKHGTAFSCNEKFESVATLYESQSVTLNLGMSPIYSNSLFMP